MHRVLGRWRVQNSVFSFRRSVVGACAIAAALAACLPTSGVSGASGSGLPPIRHVFIIMDENESATSTFGDPSADPYLAKTLPSEGAFLPNYFAIGHASNDNYVAIVSGQPPNVLNQTDCIGYGNFVGLALPGQVDQGVGCIYPSATQTVGNQLTAAGLSWKAYEQDMGNVPNRESAACGHPPVDSIDNTQEALYGDGYATRHDPFPYFHSVIDNTTYCDDHVVALGSPAGAMPPRALPGETGLAQDLKSAATTPNYVWITPNLCMDGHDYPCHNEPSGTSALNDIDRFLETWVPMITSSPAYKDGGLLIITFDEGSDSDTQSCCNEQPGLSEPLPGETGPGGGRIGTVVLSPYIKPGTVSTRDYNHYSTLATIETLFGLPRLGEAKTVSTIFGADVFTNSH
jgi:phospholipase C